MKPGKEQLIRYFKGTCSQEEETLIQAYVATGQDASLVEECVKIAWEATGHEPLLPEISPLEREQAWERFIQLRSPVVKLHSIKKGTASGRWRKYAAAAILIGCAIMVGRLFTGRRATDAPKLSYQHLQVPVGERRLVKLPDGSSITLYPGSSVDIPDNYNQKDRALLVSGRAFLEVKPDAQRPFYVTTAGLTTRVLGTAFEVNTAYSYNQVAITLLNGAVSVSNGSKELASLSPHQQLTFDTVNATFEVKHISADQVTAWTKGMLVYDQIRLDSICKDLEKWYGISIMISDPQLVKKRITISLKQQPVNEMLRILSETSGFKYTMKQKYVSIY